MIEATEEYPRKYFSELVYSGKSDIKQLMIEQIYTIFYTLFTQT